MHTKKNGDEYISTKILSYISTILTKYNFKILLNISIKA